MTKGEVVDFIAENHIMGIAIAGLLALLTSYLIRKYLSRFLDRSSDILNVDPTQYNFLKNASTAIIFGIAIAFALYLVPSLHDIGTTLFAGAGVAAAVLAFASQQALSNIISGIFLVVFRPIRVGDIVQIGATHMGTVEDITLRHTVIRNFEYQRIVIPNSVMSQETIINNNIKDEKICRFIEFGIAYDANVDLAKQIIQEEAMQHPHFIDNRTEEELQRNQPALVVRMVNHGDSSVTLRAYFWANGLMDAVSAHYDLLESVKKRFDAEGIEIPFPYRTVVLKKEEK